MVKRHLIMEKALELFAEQGIEATSIQQITERCGISKGAFYLAFKSKEELIFQLIDHFMGEYVADIERMVSSGGSEPDKMLYDYYAAAFGTFHKHAHFAQILMKEPVYSFQAELIERLEMYDAILNDAARTIVLRRYPSLAPHMLADLVFTIQGFVRHYGALFLRTDVPFDIPELCEALVEKTDLLAKHAVKPAVPGEIASYFRLMRPEPPRREELIEWMARKAEEEDDPVLRRSLTLLQEHLVRPVFEQAIVEGLLTNLREHPRTKWAAYLYESYLKTL